MRFVFLHGLDRFFGGLRQDQIAFIRKSRAVKPAARMIVRADLKAETALQALGDRILMIRAGSTVGIKRA